MPSPQEIDRLSQVLMNGTDAAQGEGSQLYPRQPNGLPDLSGTPAFGQNGFTTGLKRALPQILMDQGVDLGSDVAGMALGPMAGAVAGPVVRAVNTPVGRTAAGTLAGMMLAGTATDAGEKAKLPSDQWFTKDGSLKIGPDSSQTDIKAMQRFLQGINKYKGPIDGVWKGGTADAASGYASDLKANAANELEAERLKTEQSKAETDKIAATEAAQKASKFSDFADRARVARGAWDSFTEDHPVMTGVGTSLAYLLGGLATQRLAGKAVAGAAEERIAREVANANSSLKAAAAAAKGGLEGPLGTPAAGNRADMAGELNNIWNMRSAQNESGEVPFTRAARGYRFNSDAPSAMDLYPGRTLGQSLMQEAPGFGLAAGENAFEAYRGYTRWQGAQEDYKKAKEQYDAAPFSEESARKLLEAEGNVKSALANFAASAGSSTVGGGIGVVKGISGADYDAPTLNRGRADALTERLRQAIAVNRKK